ncbi:MAG: helix-turn-helix domain-containing protein [Proteobacteria bacterium]|nr:helix-turn-helix domain-containing protein [Pseudomonadota bacterium]
MTHTELNTSDPLLCRRTVAEYLGVKLVTLEKWAQLGTGPKYIKVGRLPRYRKSDLDRWLNERTIETDTSSGFPTAA